MKEEIAVANGEVDTVPDCVAAARSDADILFSVLRVQVGQLKDAAQTAERGETYIRVALDHNIAMVQELSLELVNHHDACEGFRVVRERLWISVMNAVRDLENCQCALMLLLSGLRFESRRLPLIVRAGLATQARYI